MNMNIVEPEYLRTSTELTIQTIPPNPHFLDILIRNFEVKNSKAMINPEVFFMKQLEMRFEDYQKMVFKLKLTQKNTETKEDENDQNMTESNPGTIDFSKFCTTEEQEKEIEEVLGDLKFLWGLIKDIRKVNKKAVTEAQMKVYKSSSEVDSPFEVILLKGDRLQRYLSISQKDQQKAKSNRVKKLNLLTKELLTKNEYYQRLFPDNKVKVLEVYFEIKAGNQVLFESDAFDSCKEKYSSQIQLHIARYFPLDQLQIILYRKGLFGGKILEQSINLNEVLGKNKWKNSSEVTVHFDSEQYSKDLTKNDIQSSKSKEGESQTESESTGNTKTTGSRTRETKTTGNTITTGKTENSNDTEDKTKTLTEEKSKNGNTGSSDQELIKIPIETVEEHLIENWLTKYEVSNVVIKRIKKQLLIEKSEIKFDLTLKIENLIENTNEEQRQTMTTKETEMGLKKFMSIGDCGHQREYENENVDDNGKIKLKKCIICETVKESMEYDKNQREIPEIKDQEESRIQNDFLEHWFANRNMCDPRRFLIEFTRQEGIEALSLDPKKLKNFFRISSKSLRQEIINKVKNSNEKSKYWIKKS
jgi:hypothetical protein